MNDDQIVLTVPPRLPDRSAYELCEFFYDIAAAVENHYASQLKRYYKKQASFNQYDGTNEELPF